MLTLEAVRCVAQRQRLQAPFAHTCMFGAHNADHVHIRLDGNFGTKLVLVCVADASEGNGGGDDDFDDCGSDGDESNDFEDS